MGIISWLIEHGYKKEKRVEHSKHNSGMWILHPFWLGFASCSVIWGGAVAILVLRRGALQKKKDLRRKRDAVEEEEGSADGLSMSMRNIKIRLSNLSSRVGELPYPYKTRGKMRWPWDRDRSPPCSKEGEFSKKQSMSEMSSVGESDEDVGYDIDSSSIERKSGLCIGSIFGLDVGGTLAKLVYLDLQAKQMSSRPSSSSFSSQLRALSQDPLPDDDITPYEPRKEFSPFHRFSSMPEDNHHSNTNMKKSVSMFELSKSKVHIKALDTFYTFARRLDAFAGSTVKEKQLSYYSRELGGEFHFIHFETRRMENAMQLIKANNQHVNIKEMGATGGGAHKYAHAWDQLLGIQMKRHDELDSLVAGMQFLLADSIGECYTFKPSQNDIHPTHDYYETWSRKVQCEHLHSQMFPYLLVTIGTGVSIIRVDGHRRHERISGSTIGGGTYWGLCRLLTDVEDFEHALNLASKGDSTKADMMVGDIYGENTDAFEKLGLPKHIVASSFGKLVAKQNPAAGLTQEDLARALLIMVTNNIGQVAYLNAQLHNTQRIYFVGNFLRHNDISQRRLAYAINFWSKGNMEALFLEHEGYFGALGAFLLSQGITHSKNDVNESSNGGRHRSCTLDYLPVHWKVGKSKNENGVKREYSHHRSFSR